MVRDIGSGLGGAVGAVGNGVGDVASDIKERFTHWRKSSDRSKGTDDAEVSRIGTCRRRQSAGRPRALGVKVMQASLCTTLTFTDSTSSRTNVRTESGRVESPVVGYAGIGPLQKGADMHAGRLKKVGSSDGPFASVYFEDVRNREDARERFELEWRSMRNQLTKQGVSESLIARLDEVKDNHHGISGRAGRAIVATSRGSTDRRYSARTCRLHYRDLGRTALPDSTDRTRIRTPNHSSSPKVDHTGADLCVRDARGRDVYGETVDGDGFPVHKAHVGGQERYTDSQSLVEENIRKNLTQAVERAAALAREHKVALVVVIGEVQSRKAFAQLLPSTLRVVDVEKGSRSVGSTPAEVSKSIRELIDTQRLRRMDVETERYVAEQGRDSGLSIDGDRTRPRRPRTGQGRDAAAHRSRRQGKSPVES